MGSELVERLTERAKFQFDDGAALMSEAAATLSAQEEQIAELERRLATSYHVKTNMNDMANGERHLRLAAEAKVAAQEEQIERLRAKVERYEGRLEIDHCYVMVDGNPELERREVPADEREAWPDGITCRDETIRLLEEQIARQEEQIERLTARLQDTADASELRLQRLVEANDEIERLRLEGSRA